MTCDVLIGAGIYVKRYEYYDFDQSYEYYDFDQSYDFAIPNNTALQWSDIGDELSLYCLSNSTTTEYLSSFSSPYGNIFPYQEENDIFVSEYSTGIYIYIFRYNNDQGVYVCNIADSNGYIINLSFGVYRRISCKLL